MKYRTIFFDLDNTLLDFSKGEAWAFKEAVTELHGSYRESLFVHYSKINHALWAALERGETTLNVLKVERFKSFVRESGLTVDAQELNQLFLQRLSATTFEIEGAFELLKSLTENEVQLILITNGLTVVQRPRLAASRLTQFFNGTIISDEVGIAKPAPGIFEIAIKEAGSPSKAEILMVGDNLTSDIRGAADFGIATCWFNPKQKQNSLNLQIDFECVDLDSLQRWLET